VDKRVKRDGKFIEILGQYQPLNPEDKQINLKQERVQYWLKNGAQPSDTTRAILKRSGLFPS
jgi:small subunit ribosomal protein S16